MDLTPLALDEEWLACLDEVARESGLALAPGRLAAAVGALSDAYNTGAFARARTKEALAARLMFSFPRDVPKMGAAVRELALVPLALVMPAPGSLRVLDVGAGLGASTFGFARMLALAGRSGKIKATLVDEDEAALGVARAIARRRTHEGDIEVHVTTSRERPRGQRFDVVLVGQSLGEITSDEARQAEVLAELLDDALEAHGSLVVVEPALRERTRRLHRVRDRLLERAHVTVFAPCLHASECPALADPNAWCHEDLAIDLPKSVATLARAAGLRWQGLTFSYLVLRKDGVTLRASVPEGAQRVVSSPIVTKGKRELFLCGGGLRCKVMRLDRDATKKDAWSCASRGDVLAFEPDLPKGASRVPPGTKATKIEPT